MAVALFTGAWIETFESLILKQMMDVALFTGAWIETHLPPQLIRYLLYVALFTGAWIETLKLLSTRLNAFGRALHGRVD